MSMIGKNVKMKDGNSGMVVQEDKYTITIKLYNEEKFVYGKSMVSEIMD